MDSTLDNIEQLVASVSKIAETKAELYKLKAAAKISTSLSSVVAAVIMIVFCGLALSILSFGLAFLIGSALDNTSYGFFIMGGFYALAGILIYMNRKTLVETPLSNLFIDKIIK